MKTPIITKTDTGTFEVRRHESEAPYALLKAPSAEPKSRHWRITYRSYEAPHFTVENASHKNRKSAEWELAKAATISTPYQLGLTNNR